MFAPSSDPVAQALDAMHGELDDLTEVALFALSDEQVEARHIASERLVNRAVELTLRLAADCAGRGLDTKAVMVRETQQNGAAAHRRLTLAKALSDEFASTRVAMAAGSVSEAQAEVIVKAVQAIPTDRPGIDADVARRAERALVGLAAKHTPQELRTLGQRILDVVAPDIVDEILAEQLERDHDRALRDCHLSITDDDHGRTHLRGVVPASVGAMIRRNLRALIAPRHVRATTSNHSDGTDGGGRAGEVLRKPSPERWGHAFCEWVERYPLTALPSSGGVQARAMVTIDHRQLTDALHASGVATIDGILIPAGEARRLACEAGILAHVLNGQSQPLDLGRSTRFHTTAQRLVMDHRDKTCTAEGCDWPAYLSHAHHEIAWSQGGATTVDTGRILCPHHHQLAHHSRWQMTKTKNGRVVFIRR